IELEYEHEKSGRHVVLTATEKFSIPEHVYDLIFGLAAGSIHCAAYSLLGDQFFDYLNHTTVYLKADARKFPDLLFLTGDRIKFEFGCNQNRISFCKDMALRKLPNGNRSVLKTTIESSKKLLLENEQNVNPHKIVSDICAILEQKNDSNMVLQDVAEEFCISPRTLRRHLSIANTSYGKIVLDRKMNKARKHLTKQGISIKEITYQLGYSDVSNFSIAFKKYFGESPAAFRKKSQV
ncbi:MAG: helix-turn-helix transcriptional regulator, partial [Pseudomonadales bacterium]|nr:helix-turn-helix transcriptional regulator [Pseudomonadales bacterium]